MLFGRQMIFDSSGHISLCLALLCIHLSVASIHICNDNCPSQINCEQGEPCVVRCTKSFACRQATVNCPSNQRCEVHCINSNERRQCEDMIINANTSSHLLVNVSLPNAHLLGNTDPNTMDNSIIRCPILHPCRIYCDGDDLLRQTHIYSVQGFHTVNITATRYKKKWCYRAGIMWCTNGFTSSCPITTDQKPPFQCSSLSDEKTCDHYTLPPAHVPSTHPSTTPTSHPSANPSIHPSLNPSINPTLQPSTNPSISPTLNPSIGPSVYPTLNPSVGPSIHPTSQPSIDPTSYPSINPSVKPTIHPSTYPSTNPTLNPSTNPISTPSMSPSIEPTQLPSQNPITDSTIGPSFAPTNSDIPTTQPTTYPSSYPSLIPSTSASTTHLPTTSPITLQPTKVPNQHQTKHPTQQPVYITTHSQAVPSNVSTISDTEETVDEVPYILPRPDRAPPEAVKAALLFLGCAAILALCGAYYIYRRSKRREERENASSLKRKYDGIKYQSTDDDDESPYSCDDSGEKEEHNTVNMIDMKRMTTTDKMYAQQIIRAQESVEMKEMEEYRHKKQKESKKDQLFSQNLSNFTTQQDNDEQAILNIMASEELFQVRISKTPSKSLLDLIRHPSKSRSRSREELYHVSSNERYHQ